MWALKSMLRALEQKENSLILNKRMCFIYEIIITSFLNLKNNE